jgi:hypothetical protein
MRKLKTTIDLVGLPGWTVDPIFDDPDILPGATWAAHGVNVSIAYDADSEVWEVWAGEAGPIVYNGGDDDQDSAVTFALSLVEIATTAAAHAVAAAAPPPPPTTIAELATRPGWRLDDGDAIHDGAKIIAEPNRVDLGLGDVVSCLDEREAAELAFAIAPITARAQIRYAAANPDQE